MYRHDDVQQPRDRRAWTDDEDELLRAAIDKGEHAVLLVPTFQAVLCTNPYHPQRTVTPTHQASGTPSQSTSPTARTKTAASGGGRRWPLASQRAHGVQKKMNVCSPPWTSSARSGQQSPAGSVPGTLAVSLAQTFSRPHRSDLIVPFLSVPRTL